MPVKNAPYAVAKTKSEKILCLPGFDTLTTAIPVRRTIELASQLATGHLFVINPGTDNYAIMKIVKESKVSSSIQNLFSKQVFSMISSLNLRCPRKS